MCSRYGLLQKVAANLPFAAVHGQSGNYQSSQAQRKAEAWSLDAIISNLHCGIQIPLVAGFAEVIERQETLVTEACTRICESFFQFRIDPRYGVADTKSQPGVASELPPMRLAASFRYSERLFP